MNTDADRAHKPHGQTSNSETYSNKKPGRRRGQWYLSIYPIANLSGGQMYNLVILEGREWPKFKNWNHKYRFLRGVKMSLPGSLPVKYKQAGVRTLCVFLWCFFLFTCLCSVVHVLFSFSVCPQASISFRVIPPMEGTRKVWCVKLYVLLYYLHVVDFGRLCLYWH